MSLVKMVDDNRVKCLNELIEYTKLTNICMVEVGCYAGESAAVFASIPQVKHIWCVDPWQGGYDDDDVASHSDFNEVELAFDNVAFIYGDKIHKFKGTLKQFCEVHKDIHPDLVYIDAKHTFDSCSEDIDASLEMGASFISGHDYTPNGWIGIKEAVDSSLGGPTRTFDDTSWIKTRRVGTNFSIEDMLQNSYCMVCKDDEYELFKSRMLRSGFGVVPKKYYGLYPKCLFGGGCNACALSHFVLVNMAMTLDLPHVTIFESDAYPLKDCAGKIGRFLEMSGVPDDADEVIYGNLHFLKDHTHGGSEDFCLVDPSDGWGRIKHQLWGAHAVTIFRRGYKRWINNYLKQPIQINADFFTWLTPDCYATTRSFFIQKKKELQYPEKIIDKQHLKEYLDE